MLSPWHHRLGHYSSEPEFGILPDMELTSHYEQLLGLGESWTVKSANLDLSGGSPFFSRLAALAGEPCGFSLFPTFYTHQGISRAHSTLRRFLRRIQRLARRLVALDALFGGTRRIAWWH